MNNNSYNPIEADIMPEGQDNKAKVLVNDKVNDTHAEDVLATIASVLFWVSTIGYSIIFITGIIMRVRGASASIYSDNAKYSWIGLVVMIASIIFYLINLIAWAKLKVNVNISRNLFVIKGLMLEDKEKNSPKQEKPDTE